MSLLLSRVVVHSSVQLRSISVVSLQQDETLFMNHFAIIRGILSLSLSLSLCPSNMFRVKFDFYNIYVLHCTY